MKRLPALSLAILMVFALLMPAAAAEQEGLFNYSIKPDDTIMITYYSWYKKKDKEPIEIPSEIDGRIVTEIGEYAFCNKTWVQMNIDNQSSFFAGDGNVDLIIPNTITKIGAMAFYNSDIRLSGIPASVEEIGYGAFSACGIRQFKVDGNNPAYAAVDGALYCKKTKELIAAPGHTEVHVPDGIVKIAPWACSACDGMKLYLPGTIEEIGERAFWSCRDLAIGADSVSGGRIVLPGSVKVLGPYVFSNMSNNGSREFTLIDLSRTRIAELPDFAFYHLVGCKDIKLPPALEIIGESAFDQSYYVSEITGTLPDSVKTIRKRGLAECRFESPVFSADSRIEEIGDEAFCHCSYGSGAQSMILPDTLRSIGSHAFDSSTLKTISVPAGVTSIAKEICNREKTELLIEPGTYAEQWAGENGYIISGPEDLSWLD